MLCVSEIRTDCSGSANNELNVVTCVGLMCAHNIEDTSASPVIHLVACHCNIETVFFKPLVGVKMTP